MPLHFVTHSISFLFYNNKNKFLQNAERISISGSVPTLEYNAQVVAVFTGCYSVAKLSTCTLQPLLKYMVEEERRQTKERSTYWHSISVVNRICTSYRYVEWLWLWFFAAGLQMLPLPPPHKTSCRNGHLSEIFVEGTVFF